MPSQTSRNRLVGGDLPPLSSLQLELLEFLLANQDRVVTREELAAAAGFENRRSVDVALTALRRALGPDAIRNVRNRGWILDPGPAGELKLSPA